MKKQFVNILLKNRSNLSAKESVKQIQEFALKQDAMRTSRTFRFFQSEILALGLLLSYPIYYFFQGLTSKHNGLLFENLGINKPETMEVAYRSLREQLRSELYVKDQSEKMHILDKENLIKSQRGEQPETPSPILLWT